MFPKSDMSDGDAMRGRRPFTDTDVSPIAKSFRHSTVQYVSFREEEDDR